MRRASIRDHRASILVAALSSAFGVVLLQVTGALNTMIMADNVGQEHGSVGIALAIVAFVFLVIAVYVGSIVTTNTFATIIAGRTRTIALMRLIGSSASAERRAVATEGLVVGVVGSVTGALIGTLVTFVTVRVAVGNAVMPDLAYSYFESVVAAPVIIVVISTWLASWVGSRRVLDVTPLQAIGTSQELSREESNARRSRNVAAIALFVAGIGLLVVGILVGLVTILGVLIGIVGGLLSFTGLILGAHLVMPPVLRVVGRLLGRGPEATLAAASAVRYPERSSRTTIGLVIGVTLITMFAVAAQSYRAIVDASMLESPDAYEGVEQMLTITVAVFSVLIGFSAFIAAVGMVNNLSLSVLQRQRELGLLRALGFTGGQVRRMITAEAAQFTIASLGVGLLLGTFYGWAGAQSLFGAIKGSPGLIMPSVPWLLIAIAVVACAVLTLVASVVPAHRAVSVAPVVALSVD